MADIPHIRIVITNIASSSGAALLQVYSGRLPYQTLAVQCNLTAAQNAAMQTALAAAATTVTNFDFVAGPASTTGVYNAT